MKISLANYKETHGGCILRGGALLWRPPTASSFACSSASSSASSAASTSPQPVAATDADGDDVDEVEEATDEDDGVSKDGEKGGGAIENSTHAAQYARLLTRITTLNNEKAALSKRVAALQAEKQRDDRRVGVLEAAAAVVDSDELSPRTIARKWEMLHTLACTLCGEQRGKATHALTVRRDDDGQLSLASARAVLAKFGAWKRWQVVLQPLRVKFEGEEGVDAGGLTRELFALLFDRLGDLGLFEVTRSCRAYQSVSYGA